MKTKHNLNCTCQLCNGKGPSLSAQRQWFERSGGQRRIASPDTERDRETVNRAEAHQAQLRADKANEARWHEQRGGRMV